MEEDIITELQTILDAKGIPHNAERMAITENVCNAIWDQVQQGCSALGDRITIAQRLAIEEGLFRAEAQQQGLPAQEVDYAWICHSEAARIVARIEAGAGWIGPIPHAAHP
jgi:hypothetical protein